MYPGSLASLPPFRSRFRPAGSHTRIVAGLAHTALPAVGLKAEIVADFSAVAGSGDGRHRFLSFGWVTVTDSEQKRSLLFLMWPPQLRAAGPAQDCSLALVSKESHS